MRAFFTPLMAGLLMQGMACTSGAQIRDDESSAVVLSVQCAMSSGFSASGFEEYSRGLAKTLALLTASQQVRVFGYLPQPAAFIAGGKLNGPNPAGTEEVTGTASSSGGIIELLGGINETINGTNTESNSVYGGEQPGGTVDSLENGIGGMEGEQVSSADSMETNSASGNGRSLSDVRAWFNAAGAAFKSGTLRDFLAGGMK